MQSLAIVAFITTHAAYQAMRGKKRMMFQRWHTATLHPNKPVVTSSRASKVQKKLKMALIVISLQRVAICVCG